MLKKVFLIDTAVLIHDVKLENDAEIYVVEGVINEAKSLKSKLRKEIILTKAKIYKPSKEKSKKLLLLQRS
jgi:rRNA maturation endonuclease Nob1